MTQHLTLEALIAGEHSDCQHCEAEAAAWAAVRAGVRHRAGATPPLGKVLERPHRGPRYLASAAAAAVLLAAAGYGVASALGHSTTHATQHAELTATGCTGLELAGGTLTRVSGSDLEITTANGSQVTVTTTQATAIYRETNGTLADITDGERVLATGSVQDETLAATEVGVLPGTVTSPATPAAPAGPGIGLVSGTVENARDGGFTVVEKDGAHVAVTTSSATAVSTTVRSTVAQLKIGEVTSAVGTAGADGTLAATTVEQNALHKALPRPQPPSGLPAMPSGLPTTSKPNIALNGLGCSPAAITTSYLLLLSDS